MRRRTKRTVAPWDTEVLLHEAAPAELPVPAREPHPKRDPFMCMQMEERGGEGWIATSSFHRGEQIVTKPSGDMRREMREV